MNTVLSPQAQTKALDIMPFADLRNQSCRDALCKSQDTFTRLELAKAVREMIIKDPHYKSQIEVNDALQAVLKVIEGTK
jgi:hypothetical protein